MWCKEDGVLAGSSSKGIDKISGTDYNKINSEIHNNNLITDNIGTAEKPNPVTIESYHKHAVKRMQMRNISEEDAQGYVDRSIIAFNQSTAEAYYSTAGVSVVRKRDNQLITTFSNDDFDDSAKEIIKVAKKYGL